MKIERDELLDRLPSIIMDENQYSLLDDEDSGYGFIGADLNYNANLAEQKCRKFLGLQDDDTLCYLADKYNLEVIDND